MHFHFQLLDNLGCRSKLKVDTDQYDIYKKKKTIYIHSRNKHARARKLRNAGKWTDRRYLT